MTDDAASGLAREQAARITRAIRVRVCVGFIGPP
jgi:hypothetical protein